MKEDVKKIEAKVHDVYLDFFPVIKEMDNLQFRIKNIEDELFYLNKDYNMTFNAHLVHRINALIAHGVDKDDAIIQIANEIAWSPDTCLYIYNRSANTRKTLVRFARIYTAKSMKKAGFLNYDIAKALGVTEKYIYQLLRTKDIPLDFK